MVLPLKWMPAYSHGGPFAAGRPTCVVVHCTESDNTPAMAEALMGPNWFGGPKAGTSAHKTVDVDSICEGVKRTTVAFHAGPGGNVTGIAYEFCGRASWTAAKWREPAQLQMLRNAAPHIADDLRAIGAPARWLSLAQLAAKARGMCTHNDVRLALGGTTHSDPGPGFPYAELLAYVAAALAGQQIIEEDDMPYTRDEIKQMVREAVFDSGEAPGVLKPGSNGGDSRVDPDNRVGFMIADMHKTGRAVYDLLTGVNERGRDGKRTSVLGKLRAAIYGPAEEPNAVDTIKQLVTRLAGEGPVDEARLAQLLAPQLQTALTTAVAQATAGQDLTAEQAEAAAERALRRVLGSLNGATA